MAEHQGHTKAPEQRAVTPASDLAASACVASLVSSGLPPDVIELLIYGSKRHGVSPNALTNAVNSALETLAQDVRRSTINTCAKVVEIYRVSNPDSAADRIFNLRLGAVAAKIREL